MQVSKVGFFSPLSGCGTAMGYGYAAVQLIKSWQRLGVPVWSHDREAPVIFNMGQPHFYERVEGKLNIGYTPWESNRVPQSWIGAMNSMDEIWTTCHQNKLWYEDAGVEVPVKVLHHGINSEHWPLVKRGSPDGPFKFLHVGGEAKRKGAKIVYEQFKDSFGDSKDVLLYLKASRLDFTPMGKNVIHIEQILPQDLLTQLNLDSHAMIYPTSGEGFGLIPFQAAATGMPTAVTNWSGPVDYMRHCYPVEVSRMVDSDYAPHEGLWAQPSSESVSHWMLQFVNNYEFYRHDAYEKGLELHRDWSWDSIAKSALEDMVESLKLL